MANVLMTNAPCCVRAEGEPRAPRHPIPAKRNIYSFLHSLPFSHAVSSAKNAHFPYCLANSSSSFKTQLRIPCFGELFWVSHLYRVGTKLSHKKKLSSGIFITYRFVLWTSLGLKACLSQHLILPLFFLSFTPRQAAWCCCLQSIAQKVLRSKNVN